MNLLIHSGQSNCVAKFVALIALLTALAETRAQNNATAGDDMAALQGSWECIATKKDGKPVNNFVGVKAIIKGDQLTWIFKKPDGTEEPQEARFSIDPAAKHFDWYYVSTGPSKMHRRLYAIDGDTLRWADNLGQGGRPESFDKAIWQFEVKRLTVATDRFELRATSPIGLDQKGHVNATRFIEGWGESVDPKGDCRFDENNGLLTISVPGTQHNLNPMPGWQNLDASRMLQEVDGDFELKVVAAKFPIPRPKSASNKEKPYSMVFSGLVIWQDDKHFLRYARAGNGDNGTISIQMEYFINGIKSVWSADHIADDDTILYASRKGGTITLAHKRAIDLAWSHSSFILPEGEAVPLRNKVRAGVFVINATNQPIAHQFADLQLKKN